MTTNVDVKASGLNMRWCELIGHVTNVYFTN